MGRYTADQIKKTLANRNRKLALGNYRLRLIGAVQNDPSEPKYNMSHKLVFALCKVDGEMTNTKVSNYVTWPFVNPEVDGHKVPNTDGLVIPVVQAFFPEECPLYPARNFETKQLEYQGEAISPEDEEACATEAATMAWDKMDTLLDSPESWPVNVDDGSRDIYAQVYYQKDKDTGEISNWASIRYPKAEASTGKYAPVADDAWYSDAANGSGGKKAAAGFKTGRKSKARASKAASKAPARKRTSKKKASSTRRARR